MTRPNIKIMTNGNDSAFTNERVVEYGESTQKYLCSALSKREYFAAMAMQGMLTTRNSEYGYEDSFRIIRGPDGKMQWDDDGEPVQELVATAWQKYAKDAVEQADALIAALNKPLTPAKDEGDDVE